MDAAMSVGDLARRTGISVRTLHHYEAIGLMAPAARTEAGHRRYAYADLERLQRIIALRAVGLPLADIKAMLEGDMDPLVPVERLRAHLADQITAAQQLIERLDAIAMHYRSAEKVSAEDLIQMIRLATMFEKHYTPDQLDQLKQRSDELGPERIQEVQKAWEKLFAELQTHMETGTDPADPAVQELARRAESLIAAFTGGDSGIRRSLENAYRDEQPAMHEAWGIDARLGAYYGKAMDVLHGNERPAG